MAERPEHSKGGVYSRKGEEFDRDTGYRSPAPDPTGPSAGHPSQVRGGSGRAASIADQLDDDIPFVRPEEGAHYRKMGQTHGVEPTEI